MREALSSALASAVKKEDVDLTHIAVESSFLALTLSVPRPNFKAAKAAVMSSQFHIPWSDSKLKVLHVDQGSFCRVLPGQNACPSALPKEKQDKDIFIFVGIGGALVTMVLIAIVFTRFR